MAVVRTTIRIDDDLYRAVKARAAQRGRPVGDVIVDAVRAFMAHEDAGRSPDVADLPVWGEGGLLPGVDASTNAALRSTMDEEAPLDALR